MYVLRTDLVFADAVGGSRISYSLLNSGILQKNLKRKTAKLPLL